MKLDDDVILPSNIISFSPSPNFLSPEKEEKEEVEERGEWMNNRQGNALEMVRKGMREFERMGMNVYQSKRERERKREAENEPKTGRCGE